MDRILDDRLVTMMYQPITSLLDDSVVGYEALARGPEGSPLATPAARLGAGGWGLGAGHTPQACPPLLRLLLLTDQLRDQRGQRRRYWPTH